MRRLQSTNGLTTHLRHFLIMQVITRLSELRETEGGSDHHDHEWDTKQSRVLAKERIRPRGIDGVGLECWHSSATCRVQVPAEREPI
jgi:hypothetical protein